MKDSQENLETFKQQFTSRLNEIEELIRKEEREKHTRVVSDMERQWKSDTGDYKAQLRERDTVVAELRREISTLKGYLKHPEDLASEEQVQAAARCIRQWREKVGELFGRQQPEIRAFLAKVEGGREYKDQ